MVDDARALLEQTLKGKPDDEILGFVQQFGGTETALNMIFEGMKSALNPEKAQDCQVAFEVVDGDTTHSYVITIANKEASFEKTDATGDARVTLGLSLVDFLRLIIGELDGMQAFMQGKLKLKGDMMFAQQVPQMFGI